MSFNPGDVVILKSGSQRMTVSRIDDDGDVHCIWSDGKKIETHYFHSAVLKKPEPLANPFDDF